MVLLRTPPLAGEPNKLETELIGMGATDALNPHSLGNPINWKLAIEQEVSMIELNPHSLGNPINWKRSSASFRQYKTASTPLAGEPNKLETINR